jgi:hypothetical protein
MDIEQHEKIAQIAQQIVFAFEDFFHDKSKRSMFNEIFNKYLSQVDTRGNMNPYEAILELSRNNFAEYEQMVKEMKDKDLISD